MNSINIDNLSQNSEMFSLSNFIDNADDFCNCKCTNSLILPSNRLTSFELDSASLNAKKLYSVCGKLFLFANNGFVYKIDGNTLIKTTNTQFTTIPKIIKAPMNYGDSVFIIGDEKVLIFGDFNGTTTLPFGDGYYVYQDFVFSYSNHTLFYGLNNNDDVLLDNFYGRIDIDEVYGNIRGISVINSNLIIVATYGILILSVLENKKDYCIKKTIALPLAVRENSVKRVGDELLFISGKKLYKYSGSKIEEIDFFIENKNYTLLDCYSDEDKYILSFMLSNKRLIYCYSIVEQNEYLIDSTNCIISDDGYLLNTTTKQLYKNFLGSNLLFSWQSKEINFDNYKTKNIFEIILCGSGSFKLTITGDCGEKVYNIYANSPLRGLNIPSKSFVVKIESLEETCSIDSLDIYYRT